MTHEGDISKRVYSALLVGGRKVEFVDLHNRFDLEIIMEQVKIWFHQNLIWKVFPMLIILYFAGLIVSIVIRNIMEHWITI